MSNSNGWLATGSGFGPAGRQQDLPRLPTNLTEEDMKKAFKAPLGKCAVCKNPAKPDRKLCWYHSGETATVTGPSINA